MTKWAASITPDIDPIIVGKLEAYKRNGFWWYRSTELASNDPYNFWRCVYMPDEDRKFNVAANKEKS